MSQPSAGSGRPSRYPVRPDWEVGPGALAAELAGDSKPLLVDCRTAQEHGIARIAGSVLIPMSELASRLGELEPEMDRRIVVHCHHGQRSLRVVAFLRERGFSDAWSLAGGIDAWSIEVDGQVPRY